jgi:hypothetical protein
MVSYWQEPTLQLICRSVSDKEKSFIALTPSVDVLKLSSSLPMWLNKREGISQASQNILVLYKREARSLPMKEAPPILLALTLLANNCKGKTLQLFCRSVGDKEKKFFLTFPPRVNVIKRSFLCNLCQSQIS